MILPGNEINTLPVIQYDEVKGTIHIKGRSIGLQTQEYFEEFFTYFKDCVEKFPINLDITFELDYFNTVTSKMICHFLYMVKTYIIDKGFKANITWIYEEDDEDQKESGENFQILTGLKFNMMSKPSKFERF